MEDKNITLSDDVYTFLKSKKRKGESFSEIIKRLTFVIEKEDLLKLKGSWKGTKDECEKILDLIYKNRITASISR